MKKRTTLVIFAFVLPLTAQGDPLFGKDWAGDREMPRTFGVGVDFFSMDQPYQIDSLSFTAAAPLPPISNADIVVKNEVSNWDIKFDVWVLPFLNVFGIIGQIDGETDVDLSNTGAPLPPEIQRFSIDYDGDVYGGGAVLAFGGDRWFGSFTATFTDTSLSGDFNSSVEALTLQPRIGMVFGGDTQFWVGGFFLDAEETHSGNIDIPFFGQVGFDVALSQQEDWNPTFGAHTMFSDRWEGTIEYGNGDRDMVLGNLTYRF